MRILQRVASRFRWDEFVLDLDEYRLERAGVRLALEPKALNLLALMVSRPGHLFSKQEIFDAVWTDTAVTDHALTRVVAQLRRVLGDEAREARYLETVPTRGYRWVKAVEKLPAEASVAAVGTPPVESAPAPIRIGPHRGFAAAFALTLAVFVFLAWAQQFQARVAPGALVAREAPEAPASKASWPVQITTHSGLDLHPALSSQGDAIAFVSDRSGALEIYTRSLGGGATEFALTTDGGHNVQPAWSPDGRFIAYHSYRHGGVWVIPGRGGGARQIAPVGSKPSWSPDGLKIAFQSDEHADVAPTGYGAQGGSTIWITNADGSGTRRLTNSERPVGGHASPVWSADGRRVAFSVFDGPDKGIWTVATDTGETALLERGGGLFEAAFAPDGSAVFVAGGDALIVRLPIDKTTGARRGPREIIPVAGVPGVRAMSISSDGRRLAFAGLSLDSQIWSQSIKPDGTAAGAARALTRDTNRRNTFPAISDDGSRIAYVSTRRGDLSDVSVMDIDGANVIQITPDDTSDHKPTWFPGGNRLAYWSATEQGAQLWALDITTRRGEKVFDFSTVEGSAALPGRVAEFQLSPSMKSIAFSLITPAAGRRALFVTPYGSLAPRRISADDQSVGYPAWSPDERRLAVEMKNPGSTFATSGPSEGSTHAGIIDLDSGKLRQLTRVRGQTWVRSWSPDGTKLAVAALRNGVWDLRWIDVATGVEGIMLPATSPRVYVRYPAWSPRGDVVVFERGEMRGNIWTIGLK